MAKAKRHDYFMPQRPSPDARRCNWPGCPDSGEHRAPKSRDHIDEHYWFCMDHAREYNASWNYYAGMSDDEVEADRRRDTVWHRPSWRLGTMNPHQGLGAERLHDGFAYMGEDDDDAGTARRHDRPPTTEGEAMAILDLRPPVNVDSVKARYKELVKRHHPDANGGDKRSEELFKKINQAYQTVMAGLGT